MIYKIWIAVENKNNEQNEKWFRAENINRYTKSKSELENDSGGDYIACIESSKSELEA